MGNDKIKPVLPVPVEPVWDDKGNLKDFKDIEAFDEQTRHFGVEVFLDQSTKADE